MTTRTLIFDWSRLDRLLGTVPTSGSVSVTPVRRSAVDGSVLTDAPVHVHVGGRAEVVVPVTGAPGPAAYRLRWRPAGGRSWTVHVLVPAGPPVLAHELDAVDKSSLTPLAGEDAVTAADLIARVQALADGLAATPTLPDGLVTRTDLEQALAGLPGASPSVSHIAVTPGGRLAHQVGGTITLTTTSGGRLAAARA